MIGDLLGQISERLMILIPGTAFAIVLLLILINQAKLETRISDQEKRIDDVARREDAFQREIDEDLKK